MAGVGGNWDNGSNAGLFYLNTNNDSSNSNSNIGSRLFVLESYDFVQTFGYQPIERYLAAWQKIFLGKAWLSS